MRLKVKDLIFPQARTAAALASNPREAPADRLYCHDQLRAVLWRVLDALMLDGPDRPPAILLIGEAQSGKSSLLRLLRGVLRDPAGPVARKIFPDAVERATPARLWLVIDLSDCLEEGAEPAARLAEQLAESVISHGVLIPDVERLSLLELLRSLPEGVSVLVTVDNLEAACAHQEEAVCRLFDLMASLRPSPDAHLLHFLLVARLEAFSLGLTESNQLDHLRRISEVVLTDRLTLVNAVIGRLIPKTELQQREIAWLLSYLKLRLPRLEIEEHDFLRCYPLSPPTLELAGQLWRHLPQFSLSSFLLDCVRMVYRRPAISIFALDDLFSLIEARLRRVPQWRSLFAAYDQVMRRAVQRLNPEWRLWGRMLARALALHTVAEAPATSRQLAEGCLIYDPEARADSYELIAMLLDQMQRLAPEHIQSDGRAEPRYHLAPPSFQSLSERLLAESRAMSDASPQLFNLLCRCGQTFFLDWPLAPAAGVAPDSPAMLERNWRAEQAPGLLRLFSDGRRGEPLRVVILCWTLSGKLAQVRPTDLVWRIAAPTPAELQALKSLAVLLEWQQTKHPDSYSPQFAELLADMRARANQAFMRLFMLDGHLSQNARPVLIDCEPPLSLLSLLQRQLASPDAEAPRDLWRA